MENVEGSIPVSVQVALLETAEAAGDDQLVGAILLPVRRDEPGAGFYVANVDAIFEGFRIRLIPSGVLVVLDAAVCMETAQIRIVQPSHGQ